MNIARAQCHAAHGEGVSEAPCESTPCGMRASRQRGFPHHHCVAHTRKVAAKIPVVQRHGPHQNFASGDFDTTTVWFLPDLHQPGFLWFNAMLHTGKASAKVRVATRRAACDRAGNGDSHTIRAWPTWGRQQRRFPWAHARGGGGASRSNTSSFCLSAMVQSADRWKEIGVRLALGKSC